MERASGMREKEMERETTEKVIERVWGGEYIDRET